MSNQPGFSSGSSTPVFVEDLFVTTAFLIKGRLPNKHKRLTNTLEDVKRAFLPIEDATMVSLRGGEVIHTPSVMVNSKEILFAHEFLEMSGDEVLRKLALPNKTVRIRAFYSGPVQMELSGFVEPKAYELWTGNTRNYFIMRLPKLRGLDLEMDELQVLNGLDYAIVRKDKLAYVYDFGG